MVANVTYFVCGLVTDGAITATLTPSEGAGPLPDLVVTHGTAGTTTVKGSNGGWNVSLAAGEQVLSMQHEDTPDYDAWPGVEIKLSAPATFVTWKDTAIAMKTWSATVSRSDPKDPWPRPWFARTFAGLKIVLPRG